MTYESILAAICCVACLAGFAVTVKRAECLAELPGPDNGDLLMPMLTSLVLMGCALAFGSAI